MRRQSHLMRPRDTDLESGRGHGLRVSSREKQEDRGEERAASDLSRYNPLPSKRFEDGFR